MTIAIVQAALPLLKKSQKPTEEPTDGYGHYYTLDDISSGDDYSVPGDADTNSNLETDQYHFIPGCADHPLHTSSTSGTSSVNDDAIINCPSKLYFLYMPPLYFTSCLSYQCCSLCILSYRMFHDLFYRPIYVSIPIYYIKCQPQGRTMR